MSGVRVCGWASRCEGLGKREIKVSGMIGCMVGYASRTQPHRFLPIFSLGLMLVCRGFCGRLSQGLRLIDAGRSRRGFIQGYGNSSMHRNKLFSGNISDLTFFGSRIVMTIAQETQNPPCRMLLEETSLHAS